MNLAEALRDAQARLREAGIEDVQLEAHVLLRHVLGLSREALFARLQEELGPNARSAYDAALARRLAHEPTAYIVGHKEFYGLDLACTRSALIPRPETELLAEYAIDWSRRRSCPSLLDMGTGNGAIAIALAVSLPEDQVTAIDASRPALKLARRNATAHGVQDRLTFVQGNLLASFREQFDVIVANLPYIPALTYAKLPPEIREHEPERALRAGVRGTSVIERLLEQAPRLLIPGGLLLAEHSWNQGRTLRDAARLAFPDAAIETRRDLAGRERMLVVQTR